MRQRDAVEHAMKLMRYSKAQGNTPMACVATGKLRDLPY
jgi:hypothetical protein